MHLHFLTHETISIIFLSFVDDSSYCSITLKPKLLRTTQYWMKKLKFALVHIYQDKVFQTIKFAEFHFSPANHSFLLCGFLFCCITGVLAFVSLREQTSKEKNLNIRVHVIIFVWVQGKCQIERCRNCEYNFEFHKNRNLP